MAKDYGKGHSGRGCGLGTFITPMGKVSDTPTNAKTSLDDPPFNSPAKSAGGPALKIKDTAPGEKAATIKTTMQPLPASSRGIKK